MTCGSLDGERVSGLFRLEACCGNTTCIPFIDETDFTRVDSTVFSHGPHVSCDAVCPGIGCFCAWIMVIDMHKDVLPRDKHKGFRTIEPYEPDIRGKLAVGDDVGSELKQV